LARARVQLSASEARRVALAAQGLHRDRPAAQRDVRLFRRALRDIGVVQLDFVNVLMPAHFMMIWSRLGAYDRQYFEDFLYQSGEFTEQWAHEASIVPTSDWPLLGHRRRRFEPWKNSPLNQLDDLDAYLCAVLDRVRQDGAVTSNDLPPVKGPARKPGDWHRSIPRWALEFHFGRGNLAVRRRLPNFQRIYDLPERIIDERHRGTAVPKAAAQRELLRQAASRLGVATLNDLADFYRIAPREARPRVMQLVAEGTLSEVAIEGWQEQAYLAADACVPRAITGATLLSPFDPLAWFRPRAKRLFNFDYRIEIYVPAAKRRWGYYVLPFLVGENLVARVDLKADRQNRELLVRSAHLESGADPERVVAALSTELAELSSWLGLDRVCIADGASLGELFRQGRD